MNDSDDPYQGENAGFGPQVVADHILQESKANANLLPPGHKMRFEFKDVDGHTHRLFLDQVENAQPRAGGKVKIWIKAHKGQEAFAIVALAGIVFSAVRNARMHKKS